MPELPARLGAALAVREIRWSTMVWAGGYLGSAARPVFGRILVVPASRDGLGPFYQDVIAVDPLEPWGIASAAYRLEMPPDRAEADDLEVTHPLHTLRRLIDAPLPLAAGLP